MAVKNYNQNYEKWAMDKAKNEVIANTDTTPTFTTPIATAPGATVPGATVPPTTAPALDSLTSSVWNALPGAKTANAIKKLYESYAPVAGSPVVESGSNPSSDTPPSETPVTTQTPTDGGFAKWLETDPAMQARMRQAESDYYRNRAGYGVQGEHLAQSGLIGSGWDSHLDATAYAAMQAEKAGVRSEGYAKWLGDQETAKAETATNADKLNADSQTVFSYLVEQGKESITDADLSYLYGLGFSKDAIDKAATAYNDYAAKNKSEVSNSFKDSLNTLMGDGNAAKFLQAIGVDTATIEDVDDEVIRRVEDAYESGTIDDATRSAFYRKALMLDEDFAGKDVDYVAKQAASAVSIKTETRKRLTDEDYAAIVDKSYDELGVEKVTFGSGLGSGTRYENINITVNVNGKELTITADHAGEGKVSTEKKDALNKLFGDSTLALYNDKVYFQYDDGKWTEVKTKKLGGSEGSTDTGNAILKVVAAYSGVNNVNYKGNDYRITNDNIPANATAEEKRVATVVVGRIKNAEFERFKSGRITREQFVSDFVEDNKQYFKNIGADPEAAVNMYLDWLLG